MQIQWHGIFKQCQTVQFYKYTHPPSASFLTSFFSIHHHQHICRCLFDPWLAPTAGGLAMGQVNTLPRPFGAFLLIGRVCSQVLIQKCLQKLYLTLFKFFFLRMLGDSSGRLQFGGRMSSRGWHRHK